jgi:hypothetical protein
MAGFYDQHYEPTTFLISYSKTFQEKPLTCGNTANDYVSKVCTLSADNTKTCCS